VLHAHLVLVAQQPHQARFLHRFHIHGRLQVDERVELALPGFFTREPQRHVGQAPVLAHGNRLALVTEVSHFAHLPQDARQLRGNQRETGAIGLVERFFQTRAMLA
jgi:hypothetical protein